jgi:uncharacterized SAM-binding protein YcdF (DUF218 family)
MQFFDTQITHTMAKGFAHAIVIPILISIIVFMVEPTLTIIAGAGYVFFGMFMYRMLQNRYATIMNHPIHESAEWFLHFSAVWLALIIFIGYSILIGAFQ